MRANYHTHTSRCGHAEGTDAEYARAAYEKGFEVFGFSDHTPYWFEGAYYSTMRMPREDLWDYAESIRKLQQEYAGKMDILLGLEMEYYPKYFEKTFSMAKQAGIRYLLLSQHWVGNEEGEPYSGRATVDEKHMDRYCGQLTDAISSGLFTYLAHPDLFNFVGEDAIYEKYMRRLCRAARDYDMPLEINFVGIRLGRHYPNPKFWRLAGEEGCKVILGGDYHDPADIGVKETEEKALRLVEQFGLDLQETVSIRTI